MVTMAHRSLSEIVNDPLFKALVGDVAIIGGVQLVEEVLRAGQRKRRQKIAGDENGGGTTPQPVEVHKDLATTLLELKNKDGKVDPILIKKALEWIEKLQPAEKRKLNTLDGDQLKAVLSLPDKVRTKYIDIVTGSTVQDEWGKLKHWVADNAPKMTPSAKKIFDELTAWADEINNK